MKTIIKLMVLCLGMQTSLLICSTVSSPVSPQLKMLYIAIRNNDEDAVLKFINQGADVNTVYQLKTPLHVAVLSRNPEIVKILLNAGAKKDVKDQYGLIPYDYVKNLKDADDENVDEIIALFKQDQIKQQKKLDYEAAFNPDGTIIELD